MPATRRVTPSEKKSKNNGVEYTTFSVGVSDAKDKTTYFPVAVFGKHGEVIAKYVTKGFHVLVEGRIQVSNKGRFGIIADRVVFGPKAAPAKKTKKAK